MMRAMSETDRIWNRAATQSGGSAPRKGDRHLAAALELHTLAMSGGVPDAVRALTDAQLDDAESGLRWLGLPAAAAVVAKVRRKIADGALDDPERAERLQRRAKRNYAEAVEDDSALLSAFRSRLRTDPDAFAAV
jgi:hypothetical protein